MFNVSCQHVYISPYLQISEHQYALKIYHSGSMKTVDFCNYDAIPLNPKSAAHEIVNNKSKCHVVIFSRVKISLR